MGRFWGRSSAFAFGTSLVLAAGLLLSCDLNPQPSPPARQEGGANAAGGGPAAVSTTGSDSTGGFTPSTSTTGEQIQTGNTSSSGGTMEPDGEGPELPTQTSTGGAMHGDGGAGGAAGAAGAADEETPAGAANTPR